MNPIRVFCGVSANGEDAESQAVLEYTLRARSSRPVDLRWMKQTNDRKSFWHGWNTAGWSTPFTGFRWGIPAFCNFEGRAIYMDSDMIVMQDIAELFDASMGKGKVLQARGTEGKVRYCVMLIDCGEARKYLPKIGDIKSDPKSNKKMTDFFRAHPELCEQFNGLWNCIDGDEIPDLNDPRIKIIHYSKMNNQPHLKFAIPRLAKDGRKHWFDGATAEHWRPDLQGLFEGLLMSAEAAGYKVSNYDTGPRFGAYKRKSYAESKPHAA